jgi:subtilisin family serine protease
MAYTRRDWIHPYDKEALRQPDRGVVNQRELIVLDEDVPQVLQALQLNPIKSYTAYGLTRLTMPKRFRWPGEGSLLAELSGKGRLGHNRLVARSVMAFDGPAHDVEGTPRVFPSDAKPPKLAPRGKELKPRRPPSRDPETPGFGVQIGIVDSALTKHPYLEGGVLYDPVILSDLLENGLAGRMTGHATFVASQIKHISPGAIIEVERVISPDGLGDAIAVHDAVCRLVEAGAEVINLSLGCVTTDDQPPFVLSHAITYARKWATDNGRPAPIFVASAGNLGDVRGAGDKKFWPAADERVWAVGGGERTGRSWKLAPYSGRGNWVTVAAPGGPLLGAWTSLTVGEADWDAWAYGTGTSFSTAVITGLLARMVRGSDPEELQPDAKRRAQLQEDPEEIVNGRQTIPMYGSKDVVLR